MCLAGCRLALLLQEDRGEDDCACLWASAMQHENALVLGWEWEITKNAHAQQTQLGGRGVLSGLRLRNNKTTSTDQLQSGGGGVLHPSIL